MPFSKRYRSIVIGLSVLAGILYNSWPLGYWLNPAASRNSLASGLEATGQPYNWLFITTDVASSLLLMLACILLWRKYRSRIGSVIWIALVSVVLFGIGTIVDALLPENCVPNLQRCASFTHNHLLLVHGMFSIGASLFLFISLCVIWFAQRRNVLLNALVLGYILFGFISLIEAITPGNDGNWSQHYYITLCSLWLVLIPYAVRLTARARQPA
jgi:hypothetical protein